MASITTLFRIDDPLLGDNPLAGTGGASHAALPLIAAAENLGCKPHPLFAEARAHAARSQQIAAEAEEYLNSIPTLETVTADYAAGRLNTKAFGKAATESAVLADARSQVREAFESAADAAHLLAIDTMRRIGDDWIALLRPVIEARLAAVTATADRIPAHITTPTNADMDHDHGLRSTWMNLASALIRVNEVHLIADQLRSMGMLGGGGGQWECQDFRWLHHDKLRGQSGPPSTAVTFFLTNYRNGAQPGIYTLGEIMQANPAR
jgi:hypothetical protein